MDGRDVLTVMGAALAAPFAIESGNNLVRDIDFQSICDAGAIVALMRARLPSKTWQQIVSLMQEFEL
jgi:hypothetical protein